MTMRITVKNADMTRTAIVRVRDNPDDVAGPKFGCGEVFELHPGQERDVYIHRERDVLVSEKKGEA